MAKKRPPNRPNEMDGEEVKYFQKDAAAAKEPVRKYGSGDVDGDAPKKDFST